MTQTSRFGGERPPATAGASLEARSGLPPWTPAELPRPPSPRGLQWLGVVGPGVIVLGASIGSGEFLLGPAVFVRHGLTLLWVAGIAIVLQTLFNTELMRYTLATGEPIFTGFMRTKPSSTAWAWFYAGLYFLQVGWPAWAGTAAGAIFFLFSRRMAGPAEANAVYLIGVGTFLLCVAILLVGRRIERTLEILNWVLIVAILGGFLVLGLLYVPAGTWLAGVLGFAGFDPGGGGFELLPADADFFLLGALVAYAGTGGVGNLTLTNWARDKGYGMSSRAGYIPAAVGGHKVDLAASGFMFTPDAESSGRWRGWWRIVRADQWAVFFPGAILGMLLPALLYVTFIPAGSDIRGLGIAAALASSAGEQVGPLVAGVIAFLGAWILFKTQLDSVDGMTRAITDILWTGSSRVRTWRGGDVRAVYYAVLALIVIWGTIALRLAQPIVLLQLGANIAGVIFIISSIHLLYVNTRLLPPELRPPMWRRAALIAMALFYGFFVALWLGSLG
ncbi:MAG TPA: Nramp family divalent metal transporter [Thermoanaerobaculia bacterium]|nr:Nramp family divalent metal transporter [Thermoanaerobaculia bacterium]